MPIRSVVASVRDCLFVIALFAGSAVYAADFTLLNSLPHPYPNEFASYAHAVSSDGNTIVGDSVVLNFTGWEGRAVLWRNSASPTSLGTIPGAYRLSAWAVSANGEGIIGSADVYGYPGPSSFYWSATTGLVVPNILPGYSGSHAMAISADGSTMVGSVEDSKNPPNWQAVRWSRAQNYFVGLGYLGGSSTNSGANAVSADGTVIVGLSSSPNAEWEAFRWTEATGMVGLGFLPGGTGSGANFVSGDGRVIVGYVNFSYDTSRHAAFRWTEETGMTDLGVLPGATVTFVRAMSRDGRFIVGQSGTDFFLGAQAFRWSETGGIVSLGGLPGAQASSAIAVSDDGAVVLGQSYYSDRPSEPFVWTEARGVRSLRDVIAASNRDISYWQDLQAWALSNDGNTIVGQGYNPILNRQEGWVIRLDGNSLPTAVIGYSPQDPYKRNPISFWGTDSTDPDGDPLTYRWNFGDGTTAVGPIVSHTYAEAGNYQVILVVNDGKDSTSAWAMVAVFNHAPIANAGGPYSGAKNAPIRFDGTASTDADNDPLVLYIWDFGDDTFANGATPAHTYAKSGTYTVTLFIYDNNSYSLPSQVQVTVNNTAPIARLTGPAAGFRSSMLTWDGSGSSDANGDPLSYRWDFGDGSTLTTTTPTATHSYATVGSYRMTLTVSDGETTSSPASIDVSIQNRPPVANAGSSYSGARNAAIRFDGTASTDADGDPLTYAWDFGDSTTGGGANPMHAYARSGTYTVTLIVNDGSANSTPATAQVTISNTAPVAKVTGPAVGFKSSVLTWDGSGSSDANGDLLSYRWDFGDGSSLTTSTPTATHSYATVGSYRVTLTVSDGETTSSPASIDVSIQNRPPVANAGGPYSGAKNAAIRVDGSASTDADGDLLTYTWNFGDGTTGSGANPMHTYAATGTYTVTLTVNDGSVNSTPATAQVTISNTAPTAKVTGPAAGFRSSMLTWDGSGSSDANGDTLSYHWNFGDGSSLTTTTPAVTHSYATLGSFRVMLTVNDGETSSSPASVDVSIQNRPPIANAGGSYSGVKNAAIRFDGTASTDADGDPLTYTWNFGDGTTGSGTNPMHTYAASGTYTVTLTVNDGITNSIPAGAQVTVNNTAPIARVSGPATGFKSSVLTWDGSGSSDANGDPLSYRWDFGDGSTLTTTTPTATHSYAKVGSYRVTLTVSDGETTSSPASINVTIQSRPPIANAGPDRTVSQNTTVKLTGTATDPDGRIVSVRWRQVAGQTVTLSGNTTLSPHFVAPRVSTTTTLTFELTVTDDDGASSSDLVNVNVTRR